MALRPSCDIVASHLRQPTRQVGMSNVRNSASLLFCAMNADCNCIQYTTYIAYRTSTLTEKYLDSYVSLLEVLPFYTFLFSFGYIEGIECRRFGQEI